MDANLSNSGPIWLVGCGNMAGAMLKRWLEAGLPPETVTVIRPSGAAPAAGVRTLRALPEGEAPPRVLMLGVKPQKLGEVAGAVAAAIGPETMLVSILAGTELATLRVRFPGAGSVVRAMPNTPVALGRGVVALYGDVGSRTAELEALMHPLGLTEWAANEDQFGQMGALAGCGPAFLFRFIDAVAAAGAAIGLPADQAARLAAAMVDGAAHLAAASDESPAVLADRVASPGGTTRQGLNVLDEDGALRELLTRTLAAAERRGREMAAEARQRS
ncbi:pyrroline-5-carboxylate reductase family protein [Sphingomonas sp.]|uniref:pyrroline-5-carboxylate reductase family protein n=1 Tax=Sphingomonas sp. TaxID=28214 RepID=UPI002DB815A9|nr:pyrroline-5-carboxylate reductase dimerization domain-containing protein [Sphingomonas sp.]HEU4969196.1 pyrroline-5-carboxylate reductase dimerization domain-containing protein [Sphingomonas sp.]